MLTGSKVPGLHSSKLIINSGHRHVKPLTMQTESLWIQTTIG